MQDELDEVMRTWNSHKMRAEAGKWCDWRSKPYQCCCDKHDIMKQYQSKEMIRTTD